LFTGVRTLENFKKVITNSHLFSRLARVSGNLGNSASRFKIRRSGWKPAFSGNQGAM
jgi:hypothetical protein